LTQIEKSSRQVYLFLKTWINAERTSADATVVDKAPDHSLPDVRERMEVVGSDGMHVGTVDGLEGTQRIKLTKTDKSSGGAHHFIPIDWIERVDGKVHLINGPGRQGALGVMGWRPADAMNNKLPAQINTTGGRIPAVVGTADEGLRLIERDPLAELRALSRWTCARDLLKVATRSGRKRDLAQATRQLRRALEHEGWLLGQAWGGLRSIARSALP